MTSMHRSQRCVQSWEPAMVPPSIGDGRQRWSPSSVKSRKQWDSVGFRSAECQKSRRSGPSSASLTISSSCSGTAIGCRSWWARSPSHGDRMPPVGCTHHPSAPGGPTKPLGPPCSMTPPLDDRLALAERCGSHRPTVRPWPGYERPARGSRGASFYAQRAPMVRSRGAGARYRASFAPAPDNFSGSSLHYG